MKSDGIDQAAILAYQFFLKQRAVAANAKELFIWGYSIGTGPAAKLAQYLVGRESKSPAIHVNSDGAIHVNSLSRE